MVHEFGHKPNHFSSIIYAGNASLSLRPFLKPSKVLTVLFFSIDTKQTDNREFLPAERLEGDSGPRGEVIDIPLTV